MEGKGQIKVNGQPVTLSMLKELASILVDSYGQHESYIIFDTVNHLRLLDAFCGLQDTKDYKAYVDCYNKLKDISPMATANLS